MDTSKRLERQLEICGKEGIRRILEARLSIVGNGGLGSNLALQSALIGFRKFVLVDNDLLDIYNTNRDACAGEQDVGTPKPFSVQRRILEINNNAEVMTLPLDVGQERVSTALADTDAIFSCVDNNEARETIQHLCMEKKKPILDLGVGCLAEGSKVDLLAARAALYVPGETACLGCLGLLGREPDLSKQSIVPLNALAASHGLWMFVSWLCTGNMKANFVYIDLLTHMSTACFIRRQENCEYCGCGDSKETEIQLEVES